MKQFQIKKVLPVLLIVLMFLLTACQGSNSGSVANSSSGSVEHSTPAQNSSSESLSESSAAQGSSSSQDASSEETEKKKNYMDDLELTKTDGTTVKLSSLAKENTLLVFWATWCHFCVKEIPVLEELVKEYDNLSVVMINEGDSKEKVAEFEKANNMTLNSFIDEKSVYAQKFGISGFPSIIFLAEDLEVISFVSGKMDKEEFVNAFKLIKEFRTKRGDFN